MILQFAITHALDSGALHWAVLQKLLFERLGITGSVVKSFFVYNSMRVRIIY